VVDAFFAAARSGDFEALIAVLDPDIVLREDSGTGTIHEVRGAQNVAGRAAAFSRRDPLVRPALINGAPGWVSYLHGEPAAIGALTTRNGRIATMDILLDPARLARLDLTAFHA
jgi:RNA polymerase sigma-70 factor (ECF subfamily)